MEGLRDTENFITAVMGLTRLSRPLGGGSDAADAPRPGLRRRRGARTSFRRLSGPEEGSRVAAQSRAAGVFATASLPSSLDFEKTDAVLLLPTSPMVRCCRRRCATTAVAGTVDGWLLAFGC